MGRNVHVLFVHGVGQHSPLSSLLRAYQALRSDLKSDEAPTSWEDPIPDWSLAEFDDTGPPRYLRLVPRYPGLQHGPDSVFLYEVNYSALAGVVRANQPIDLTQLFLGFDLAGTVAKHRLEHDLRGCEPSASLDRDRQIAEPVQKLAGVLVAATVPVLGLPAMLFRQFTRNFVGAFTRFFEDVVTFALDKNGEQLISKHVDRTLQSIVESPHFQPATQEHVGDELVIAAHSLGSIVIHNFLLRHWRSPRSPIPNRLVTYGCPIGLVCWTWRFLDFPLLQFKTDPERRATGDEFFCWTPESPPAEALPPISWLNVINFLDPIATAFPVQYVNMAMSETAIRAALTHGQVVHHYIRSGSVLSAHTDYMDDRNGFVTLLARAAQLTPDEPPRPVSHDPQEHWNTSRQWLLRFRWSLWAGGVVAILIYTFWLAKLCQEPLPQALAPVVIYLWPPATLGYLAFSQRLLFGAPTKRLRADTVRKLPWSNWRCLPFKLRLTLRIPPVRNRIQRPLLGFVPAFLAMGFPLVWWSLTSRTPQFRTLWHTLSLAQLLELLAIFMIYAIAFALSEFTSHWRKVLGIASDSVPATPDTTGQGTK